LSSSPYTISSKFSSFIEFLRGGIQLLPLIVNNMNKIAKENFENKLDNILLENSSNPKTYWKIMKMLIKSNKGNNCIPPLVSYC
jgi:hypothetical protein